MIETDYAFDAAGNAFDALRETAPTAILCGNDVQAAGVLNRARMRGVDVPHDLVVTGFDDIDIAAVVTPGLTRSTFRMPGWVARAHATCWVSIAANEPIETHIVWRGSFPEPA